MTKTGYDEDLRRDAEQLFYPVSLKGKVPKKDSASRKLGATAVRVLASHARLHAQIARTTRRSPEVMVKITNRLGAGKGMAAIRNHLAYISRNSKLELETDTGERLSSKESVADYTREWKELVRGKPIPEVSHRREAFNIILSMPAGTPPDKVREAASAFLAEEFGQRYRYCFTLHTDTEKPHVHACIQTASLIKGKRLNPRKADLQRWREGFAEQLRNIGIDANATPRRTRGAEQPNIRQSAHHAQKRQAAIFTNLAKTTEWPKVYKGALAAWQRLASKLKNSESESDRQAASQIDTYIAGRHPEIKAAKKR